MLLYYRFYHPAGPILPCGANLEEKAESNNDEAPDFVIKNVTYVEEKVISTEKPKGTIESSNSVKLSRSFKHTMKKPPSPPVRIGAKGGRLPTPVSSPIIDPHLNLGNSSNNTNSPL